MSTLNFVRDYSAKQTRGDELPALCGTNPPLRVRSEWWCSETARLFISEHTSKAVFKVGQQMVDRAAPRYSPPSLRGAADDPSLRNQLQELFLSEHADRQAVKRGT